NRRTANAYEALGALYQKQGLYGLAINNYQKALKIYEGYRKKSELTSLYESMAFCYTQQKQYKEAITFYNDLLLQYQGGGNDQKVLQIRYELSELYTNSENYAAAIEINQEIAQQLNQRKQVIELSTTYNNLGFLYKRNGNTKNSVEFFYKSLALYSQNKGRLQGEQKALLLTNTGVAHTNLKAYNKAKNYFEEALKIRQDKNSPNKLADTYNYIASNYYVSGNNSQALTNVNIAIEIGERYKAQSSLLTSYKLLSLIYQQENASSKAEVYRKKFNTLNEQLQREREQKKQELLARQAQLEKEENDYKTLIARQEYQASELNRLAVEAERKEQELTILRKNQELQNERFRNQQLEQERINQLLAITQQKARAEKQQQEIALLQKSKEIQALALKQKEAEQQERNRRIELLEKDKKLKEERLEK
ncbi:MAG: tetratricopeptide repeat protein, partial [Bacteroidota bacterium]